MNDYPFCLSCILLNLSAYNSWKSIVIVGKVTHLKSFYLGRYPMFMNDYTVHTIHFASHAMNIWRHSFSHGHQSHHTTSNDFHNSKSRTCTTFATKKKVQDAIAHSSTFNRSAIRILDDGGDWAGGLHSIFFRRDPSALRT